MVVLPQNFGPISKTAPNASSSSFKRVSVKRREYNREFPPVVLVYYPMGVLAFILEAIYSIPSILHQFIHHRELLVGQSNELTEQLYRTHMRVDLGQILFNDLIVALSGYE